MDQQIVEKLENIQNAINRIANVIDEDEYLKFKLITKLGDLNINLVYDRPSKKWTLLPKDNIDSIQYLGNQLDDLCTEINGYYLMNSINFSDNHEVSNSTEPIKPQVYIPPTFAELTTSSYKELKKEDDSTKFKNQSAKSDKGKLPITFVPTQIIRDVAAVRKYGNEKYHSPSNWVVVEKERYKDALMRHLLAYLDDENSIDEESGIKHLWHAACNIAFLCEMDRPDWEKMKMEIINRDPVLLEKIEKGEVQL